MSTHVARTLGTSWTDVWLTVVVAAGIYAAIIVLSRVFGPRQFSSSTTYDLAFVFALGSLIGRVILVRTSLANAVVGLATMFALHTATGWLHHRIPVIHRLVQNPARLVVLDGELLPDQLRRGGLSAEEVNQAVRRSGHASLAGVRAVVLERNGSLSVIANDGTLDPDLFAEVEGPVPRHGSEALPAR